MCPYPEKMKPDGNSEKPAPWNYMSERKDTWERERTIEGGRKVSRWVPVFKRRHTSRIDWSAFMVVPFLIALPGFAIGVSIKKSTCERVNAAVLMSLTIVLSWGWLVFMILAMAGPRSMPPWVQSVWNLMPASVRNMLSGVLGGPVGFLAGVLLFLGPPALSGVPAGMLHNKLKARKWVAVAPLFALGMLFWGPLIILMFASMFH
jgi:hypothetical protein